MSREEVSYLGSARREEVRRMADERERLRANPLLYLVSPQVKVIPRSRGLGTPGAARNYSTRSGRIFPDRIVTYTLSSLD
jgi:hypothetical protein